MYVVIFRAITLEMDQQYSEMAQQLRTLALDEFGCLEFTSLTEDDQEIALSYWPNIESIQRWKQQSDHLVAQSLGKERWYKHYQVEIAEISRKYGSLS